MHSAKRSIRLEHGRGEANPLPACFLSGRPSGARPCFSRRASRLDSEPLRPCGRAALRLPLCRAVSIAAFPAGPPGLIGAAETVRLCACRCAGLYTPLLSSRKARSGPRLRGGCGETRGVGASLKSVFLAFCSASISPHPGLLTPAKTGAPPALLAGSRGAGGVRGAFCPAGVQLGSLPYPSLFGTTASGISLAGGKILHFWRSRPALIGRIFRLLSPARPRRASAPWLGETGTARFWLSAFI